MTASPDTLIDSSGRIDRTLRWTFGTLIFLYGLLIFDRDSAFWSALSLALFTLPLLLQATPWAMTRVYALWGGVLLVAQSLLGPVLASSYVSLPPHLNSSVEVRTTQAPGMSPGLRRITTDALGYRVQPAVNYSSRTHTRIFAIGGSTIEDIMLDDRGTWTHLLQEDLKSRGHAVEVINTGVSGLRARNHLATFRKVLGYQPDIVLILVGGNDWNRHIRNHFEPGWDGYHPALLRESPLGKLLGRFVVAPLRSRIVGASSSDQHVVVSEPDGFNASKPRRSLDRTVKHVFRPDGVSGEYQRDIEALAQACAVAGVRCVWLTQPHAYAGNPPQALRDLYWMTPPDGDYTLDLDSMQHITALYNRWLLEFTRRHNQPICDVAADMEASPSLFYDDMHFTDEGARHVARHVAPCLSDLLARKYPEAPKVGQPPAEIGDPGS